MLRNATICIAKLPSSRHIYLRKTLICAGSRIIQKRSSEHTCELAALSCCGMWQKHLKTLSRDNGTVIAGFSGANVEESTAQDYLETAEPVFVQGLQCTKPWSPFLHPGCEALSGKMQQTLEGRARRIGAFNLTTVEPSTQIKPKSRRPYDSWLQQRSPHASTDASEPYLSTSKGKITRKCNTKPGRSTGHPGRKSNSEASHPWICEIQAFGTAVCKAVNLLLEGNQPIITAKVCKGRKTEQTF